MADNDFLPEPSPAARSAFDALIEGHPLPNDTLSCLRDDERAELSGLASTALLTRAAIEAAGRPRNEAETASLVRAQERVIAPARTPSNGDGAIVPARGTGWLARWRDRRRRSSSGNEGTEET